MATCGLSATLRRGRGKAVVDEALGESFPECSAISTLPTTIMTAPSNDPAGHPRPAHATPKTPHWPDRGTSTLYAAKACHEPSPNWPGGSCWPSAALSCLTRRPRALCRRIERHIKELFEPDVPANNPAERSLAIGLPHRGHPVGTWYREQDDAVDQASAFGAPKV